MKKLIVQLTGGLGNQLFQYATGRSLATMNSAELVLDTWSGFARDRRYRRQYALDSLPIKARRAAPFERIPIWLYRLETRKKKKPMGLRPYGHFIVETELKYLPEITTNKVGKRSYLLGYFQSPAYFANIANSVRWEAQPPEPTNKRVLDLASTMQSENSIAVGIRVYEESPDPTVHSRNGKLKTISEINQALRIFTSRVDSPHIYIFCTHRNKELESLELPSSPTYIIGDEGLTDEIGNLWLLSQCRYHVITNSSFYWWGAWLSSNFYSDVSPRVAAADNFVNPDSLPKEWFTY